MPNTARYGQIEYEASQSPNQEFTQLTDKGDHKTFKGTAELWSDKEGYSPVVRPNGLITGGVVTPAVSGSNDVVDVAALTCYLEGVLQVVSADEDIAISRGADTDTHRITSITVDENGAIAAVAGTDGTEFSETRNAAGGPPLIPVGSVEIAQVRTSSITAAPITSDEIFMQIGVHRELYNQPLWDVVYCEVENGALGYAGVVFKDAMPLIHTGPTAKPVYATWYEPAFSVAPNGKDWKPPEKSHSVSSEQVYDGVINSVASSMGQGSFTVLLEDGLTDAIVQQRDKKLFFRFKPDKYKVQYQICQGILGMARSFPPGGSIQAACTVSAASEVLDVLV